MQKIAPIRLWMALMALLGLIALIQLWNGVLVLSQHEGDTIHLVDMLMRLQLGQQIHRDFHTPLGVLSLLPFSLALSLGADTGRALILGQLGLAALLAPIAAWVCATRLPRWGAIGTAGFLMILLTALIDGGTAPQIGLSMSYNRWSWALSYLALLPVFLPLPSRRLEMADGAIIGGCWLALLAVKATFAVALLPVLLLGLILSGRWRAVPAALAAALLGAAAMAAGFGAGFWFDYAGDLLAVATSDLRGVPSEPIRRVISGPAFLTAHLLLLAGVVVLRRSGAGPEGLLLLVLFPALVYIVSQNFGNDQQWLLLLAAVLLARGGQSEARIGVVATGALVLALPTAFNLGASSLRHLTTPAGEALPMFEGREAFAGLWMLKARRDPVRVLQEAADLDGGTSVLQGVDAAFAADPQPFCELASGYERWLDAVANDLSAAGFGGRTIWMADLLNPLWLVGGAAVLKDVWPWSYGGAEGLAGADLLLVPTCPLKYEVSVHAAAAAKSGWTWTLVHEAPLYRLYSASPR